MKCREKIFFVCQNKTFCIKKDDDMMKALLSYRLRHGRHHLHHRLHDHHRQCLRLRRRCLWRRWCHQHCRQQQLLYSMPPASPPLSRALPSDPDCVIFRNCHFMITFAHVPLYYICAIWRKWYNPSFYHLYLYICEGWMRNVRMQYEWTDVYGKLIKNWSSNFLASYLADFCSI
jgi:hypothetical protein